MPISSKTFDSSPDSVNPKLLDLFIKNPDKAYSFSELIKKFGNDNLTLTVDLLILSFSKIEQRSIDGEPYYRLKKKP